MKKTIIMTLLASSLVFLAKAQDAMQTMLESVERNNTQLKALRELSAAEKLGNRTANNLTNPEVEVTHKPRAKGVFAETEIEATQSFDFPTAYKHRGQVIDIQNSRVDLAYAARSCEVVQEARVLGVNYIYQLRLQELVTERAEYARKLHKANERLFEAGDINVLERNKTKLNLLEVEKDLQMCEVNLSSIKTELQRMNGGESIEFLPSEYSSYQAPMDFDSWFERIKTNNPMMQIVDKDVDMSRKQEQLTRSLNLPKLRAGYVGDLIRKENRHGFLVSVSIPLWEGRNTVKSQKAQTIAMEYEREDAVHQFRNELWTNYEKAQKLSLLLKEYSEIVDNSNNFILLKKAFDMGQLNLIEYLQELIIYHVAVDNYLEAQKDYNLALSELEQWDY